MISPFTPGPKLSELHSFEVFAEVGVVLLMFSIGVEFSIPDLMRVKWAKIRRFTITTAIGMFMNKEWALHAQLRAKGACDKIKIVVE